MIEFGGKQKFATGVIQLRPTLQHHAVGGGAQIVAEVLNRHMSGDWGKGDRATNNKSVEDGGPITSLYSTAMGPIKIVTSGGRGSTMVGFESEFRDELE